MPGLTVPAGIIARLRSWLAEGPFRRLLKNISILTAGNLGTAFVDLISLALAARALGTTQFGVLAMLITFSTLVTAFARIQTMETVVRYGAQALAQEDRPRFKQLVRLGTTLEVTSAAAAAAIALAGVHFWTASHDFEAETRQLAMLYMIVVLLNVTDTPKAVLRLFDKYAQPTAIRFTGAALRAAAVAILFLQGAGLFAFVVTWIASYAFEYLLTLIAAWLQMYQRGYGRFMRTSLAGAGANHAGWSQFVTFTHVSKALTQGIRDIDVILVGWLLTPAAAGIFKIAKQFGSIPSRLGQPIQQAVYPELAMLWSAGNAALFRNMIRRVAVLAAGIGVAIWLVFIVAGRPLIIFILGPEYGQVFPLLVLIMLGYVFYMLNLPLRPAVLSMGHSGHVLAIDAAASVIFVIALMSGLQMAGLVGAAIAQVLLHCSATLMLSRHLRKRLA